MKKIAMCAMVALGILGRTTVVPAQTINTVAGDNHAYGTSGDGGPATAALLLAPFGVATYKENLYIADGDRVRTIDSFGIIHTIAGTGVSGFSGDGGPATAAKFAGPSGLAFDTLGNIYVSDAGNFRIRKIDTRGIVTTIAGTGASGYCSGDGGPATAAVFDAVHTITYRNGKLYFADGNNCVIRQIDLSTGIITRVAGTPSSGTTVSGDGGPATAARIFSVTSLAFNTAGDLYLCGFSNTIRKINMATGIITTIAGTGTAGYSGDGGPATAAMFRYPTGLDFDPNNNLYVTDCDNNRVRKIDAHTGVISTFAGTGTAGYSGDGGLATAAYLRNPTGLIISDYGTMYFCNRWVVKVIDICTITDTVVTNITRHTDSVVVTSTILAGGADTLPITGGQIISHHLFDYRNVRIDTYSTVSRDSMILSSCVGLLYLHSSNYVDTSYGNTTITTVIPFDRNDTMYFTNGVQTLEKGGFVLYPNPTTDRVLVTGKDSDFAAELYDVSMKMVHQIANGENEFSLSDLPNGIYFVRIKNLQGVFIGRILKE